MNASFDAFDASARGGWGGGETSYGDLNAGPKLDDKIPLPVTVKELLEKASQIGPGDNEHYTVGKQAFSTVRLVGRVKFARSEQGGMCMTYGLVDLRDQEGMRSEQTVEIVRYDDSAGSSTGRQAEIRPNSVVLAVGKLRFFDNHFSVTSFHIRPIEDKLAAFYEQEAKLAKIFWLKDVPNLDDAAKKHFKGTIFSDDPPLPKQAGAAPNQPSLSRAPFHQQGLLRAPHQQQQMAPAPRQQQAPPTNGSMTTGYDDNDNGNGYGEFGGEQREKILGYIRENGETGGGVSKEQLRHALRPDRNFERDIQALLDEALIFNTTGEDVYSSI